MPIRAKYAVIARQDGDNSGSNGKVIAEFTRLTEANTYAAAHNDWSSGSHYYVRKHYRYTGG